MILLEREPKPTILVEKEATWTKRFLERRAGKPGLRPDKRQYRHAQIRAALRTTSSRKCFYCEQALDRAEETVDHYVEVAEQPELAFAWTNLYLCCGGCQNKRTNLQLSNDDCIDPCAVSHDPKKHLLFRREQIFPRSASSRGGNTIRKYELDREGLNTKRARALSHLAERLIMIAAEKRAPNNQERDWIQSLADPGSPFSSMFRDLFASGGFI